jgi:hypothetical protein
MRRKKVETLALGRPTSLNISTEHLEASAQGTWVIRCPFVLFVKTDVNSWNSLSVRCYGELLPSWF